MYTSTGIATADTTVHTDAQHDFTPSETMKKKIQMTNDANLRLVVGTYARLKRPLAYVEGIPLYEWNCLVYYPGQPFLDLSPYIERVEFTLHPSFENVCFYLKSVHSVVSLFEK